MSVDGTGPRTFDLLPAVDLRDGQVVRLMKGEDSQRTTYGDDPAAVLAGYRRGGARRAHVVDLDAALGEEAQRGLLAHLVKVTVRDAERSAVPAEGRPPLALQLGGGLRSPEDVAWALEAGFDRVVLGSLVTRDFDLFARLAEENPGRLVPALDCLGGEVRVAGWQEAASVPLVELARRLSPLPCPAVLVTDIDKDGTLQGPNLELTRRVGGESGLPALLSGGVRSLDDLRAAAAAPEVGGAVVGKALYEGAFTLEEALAVVTTPRGREGES